MPPMMILLLAVLIIGTGAFLTLAGSVALAIAIDRVPEPAPMRVRYAIGCGWTGLLLFVAGFCLVARVFG